VPQLHSIKEALNTNGYWLGLMELLQNPNHLKNFDCIRNIPDFYAALTLEDVMYMIDNYLDVENLAISVAYTSKTAKKE
jgi:hypothetical protein